MGLAFISYRRSDTGGLAQALYMQLKARFGSGQLFMDVNSIPMGGPWPTRVRDRLAKASVVLVLIGPHWLRTSDDYGRRRLDADGDWVRLELENAIRADKQIINVLVGQETDQPPREALPGSIEDLFNWPRIRLGTEPDEWVPDIGRLAGELTRLGLRDQDVVPDVLPLPSPTKARLPGLSEEALAEALETLPRWEPWEDTLPREYPLVRQELRRNFVFRTFGEAVDFMAFLAPRFDELNHHPRWSNEWRAVQIRLTTWDAHNKITEADVEAAHEVDRAHDEFLKNRS